MFSLQQQQRCMLGVGLKKGVGFKSLLINKCKQALNKHYQKQALQQCYSISLPRSDQVVSIYSTASQSFYRNNRILSSSNSSEFDSILDASQNSEVNARASILLGYLSIVCQFVVITVALPAMVADPSVALTSASAGSLMMVGTIAATLGKLSATFASQKFPAKTLMMAAMCGTGVANICVSCGSAYSYLVAVWAISRFFHAGGWVSSAQLTCSLVPESNHGSALGTLAFASRVGATMGTSALGGLLLLGFSWRSLFIVTSVVALGMVVAVKYFVPDENKLLLTRMLQKLYKRKQEVGLEVGMQKRQQSIRKRQNDVFRYTGMKRGVMNTVRKQQAVIAHYDPDAASKRKFGMASKLNGGLWSLLRLPEIWLMVATRCMLQLIPEFQSFISLMSVDWLQLTPGQASQVAAGFSMGAACSVLVGGMIYSKLKGAQKQRLIPALLACALLCLVLLGGSNGQVSVAVPCVVLLGAMFAVPFYIPISSFNMKKGGASAGALEALSETFAYSAAFAFSAGLSGMVGVGGAGWSGVIRMLTVTTLVGLVLMSLLMKYVVEEEEQLAGMQADV
eukprot:TRINITY_DN1875_c1_g2_i4.p2 TRINITY_DN1875_c1_g2~~TRINITY_DN1875_c1_g2_i4.p2  ORF type:complete len:566 (+),score=80.68 TRINITY_DN1875_c1_g2_i4:932-2629(+)